MYIVDDYLDGSITIYQEILFMKPFKTIDEQYDLLLSRGLAFTNEEKAKQYLLNNNYYNIINCYAKFFMNEQDKFLP